MITKHRSRLHASIYKKSFFRYTNVNTYHMFDNELICVTVIFAKYGASNLYAIIFDSANISVSESLLVGLPMYSL